MASGSSLRQPGHPVATGSSTSEREVDGQATLVQEGTNHHHHHTHAHHHDLYMWVNYVSSVDQVWVKRVSSSVQVLVKCGSTVD